MPDYNPRRGKTKRVVVDTRQANPNVSATDMAEAIGVSRQRVWQILKEEGLPTLIKKKHPLCSVCHKELIWKNKSGICMPCSLKAIPVFTVKCDYCGNEITHRENSLWKRQRKKNKHWFCNRHCLGKYVAAHYSRMKTGGPSLRQRQLGIGGYKYDYSQVKLLLRMMRVREAARILGMSSNYLYQLISEWRKAGIMVETYHAR